MEVRTSVCAQRRAPDLPEFCAGKPALSYSEWVDIFQKLLGRNIARMRVGGVATKDHTPFERSCRFGRHWKPREYPCDVR